MPDYSQLYQDAGTTFNVDPMLAQAVGQVESSQNPKAVSRDAAGNPIAHGVMQLTAPNLQRLNIPDPYNPQFNIPAGTRMLDEALTASNGNVPMALRIYHGGQDTSKWGPQTEAYPAQVAAAYQKIKSQQSNNQPSTGAGDVPTMRVTPSGTTAPQDDIDTFLTGNPAHPANIPSIPSASGATGAAKASAPTPQNDAVDDFLSGKEEAHASAPTDNPAAQTATPPAPASATTAPPATVQGQPAGPVGRVAQAAVKGAISGAEEGAQSGFFPEEPGLRDSEYQTLQNGSPLAKIGAATGLAGSYVNRALGAVSGGVTGGLSSAVTQTGDELPTAMNGPLLARDINAMPGAFQGSQGLGNPEGKAAAAREPISIPVTQENGLSIYRPKPSNALDSAAAPLPADFKSNPGVTQPSTPSGPTSPNPLQSYPDSAGNALNPAPTTAGAKGSGSTAQSAGAAGTPTSQTGMTPQQTQAYRSVAEYSKLNEPQPVGRDLNRYVPGVSPTMAQMEQNATVSREQKLLESQIPDDFKNAAKENNENRSQFAESIAPTEVQIRNMTDDREAQRVADTTAAWKTKTPTDPTPVTDQIQAVLNGPDGKIGSVKTAMNQLMNNLKNSDGTIENDPQRLYGVRRDIANDYSKAAVGQDATKAAGAAALQSILPTIDGVIEKGAPGYRQYMDNYAANSSAIDSAQALRDGVNGLYNQNGVITLGKVQNFLKDAVQSRAAQGPNAFKSIPDDSMQQMWNLRDDLRRSASADQLAQARGSDTAQNFMDLVKQGAKTGGRLAAHGLAFHASPIVGNVLLNSGEAALNNLTAKRAARKMQTRAQNMLNPDASQYPDPSGNPLSQP